MNGIKEAATGVIGRSIATDMDTMIEKLRDYYVIVAQHKRHNAITKSDSFSTDSGSNIEFF